MTIKTFKELEAYQLAFELQQLIFEQSKRFPKEETYSLTDQIRRSSRSVGANIAEAWRKRRYPAHFTSKLTDADGENAETQHWLDAAQACHYLENEVRDDLIEKSLKVGAMLGRMMADPVKWQPR